MLNREPSIGAAADSTDQSRQVRLTAVVLSYNYGRFLLECLASIEAQSFDDLAILVIDDASTDGSQDILRAWARRTSRPVELILKDENRGPGHSYNMAVGRLSTEFVAFIDADDMWNVDKSRKQIDLFDSLPDDTVVLYSDVEVVDSQGGPSDSLRATVPIAQNSNVRDELLRGGSGWSLNSTLIRTTALRACSAFDESIRVCDLQMWLELARYGRFVYASMNVGRVRVHGDSMGQSETLVKDRLAILASQVETAHERRVARIRGRQLLKQAVFHARGVPWRAYGRYGLVAKDPLAFIFGPLACLREIVGRRRR